MKKIISEYNEDFGVIGTPIDYNGLLVGDIVSFHNALGGKVYNGVVCFDETNKSFKVMGAMGMRIEELENIKKMVDYTFLTQDILNSVHGNYMNLVDFIPEEKVVELTISEIEGELGYKIKIIS